MNDEVVKELINQIKRGALDNELRKEIWEKFLKLKGLSAITQEQHNELAKAVAERFQKLQNK